VKISHKILVFISALLFCGNFLFAQQMLKNITIDPKNRVFLFFRNYPISFKSSLSDDKMNITLSLNNCTVADTARMKPGRGIINDVYVNSQKNGITIFISLNEQTGYTAVPLPFTRSVVVETFRWVDLTPSEDTLRQGLLALEDNIADVAQRLLFSASLRQEPLAAFHLGLLYLQQGKINSALHNLRFAELYGVDIPDLYAAISQIYSIKDNLDSASKYAKLFQSKTGFSYLPKIPIANIIETDTICLEPVSHLNLVPKVVQDSITRKDTSELAKKFEAILKDTIKKEDEIPAIYRQILTYIGGVVAGLILLVVYLYLRWRQKKQKEVLLKTSQSKNKKTSTKTDPKKQNDQAAKLMAARAYSKMPKSSVDEPKQEKNLAKTESIKFEEKQKAIENIIEEIRSEQAEKEANTEPTENEPINKPKKTVSAKFEIAMNLVEEQRKIKQKNIEKLGKEFIIETSRLNEIARSLGIEKGSLETRKAIENIEKDPEKMQKLLEKFKKD